MAAEKESGVRVLNRALDILESFTGESPALTLMEISEKSELSPSTAHRILKVLEQREYLLRDEDSKKYILGPKIRYLAGIAKDKGQNELQNMIENAQENLLYLKNEFGETSSIYVRSGEYRVCIERKESDHRLRIAIQVGERMSLKGGGAGKVLMSAMPDEELSALLGEEFDTIIEDVRKCRKQGYWVSNGERSVGVAAISAPIYNAEGKLIAAVALSGPSVRMIDEHLPEKVTAVMNEGKKISRKLGCYSFGDIE